MKAVTLQIEHGIHDVFQDSRPGNGAGLSDVANEEDGNTVPFSYLHQLCGAFAHLTHRPSSRIQFIQVDRLDGVDHHQPGAEILNVADDGSNIRLGQYI